MSKIQILVVEDEAIVAKNIQRRLDNLGYNVPSIVATGEAAIKKICEDVKGAAYEVINKKGATFYAIALVIAKIVRAILTDQFRVMTVSNVLQNYNGVSDVCLSIPTVIRRDGICEKFEILLNKKEKELFETSANKVKEAIAKAGI